MRIPGNRVIREIQNLGGSILNFDYAIQEEEGFLRMTLAGVVATAADLLIVVERVIMEAKRRGYSAVVVDESGIVERLCVLDLVEGAEMVTEFIRERGVRVASVRNDDAMATGRTLETLLRSRGMDFRVFGSQEQGVSWVSSGAGFTVDGSVQAMVGEVAAV